MKLLPLAEVERRYVMAVLRVLHDNRTQAARALAISHRGLLYKLRRWNVPVIRQRRRTS